MIPTYQGKCKFFLVNSVIIFYSHNSSDECVVYPLCVAGLYACTNKNTLYWICMYHLTPFGVEGIYMFYLIYSNIHQLNRILVCSTKFFQYSTYLFVQLYVLSSSFQYSVYNFSYSSYRVKVYYITHQNLMLNMIRLLANIKPY